MTALQESQMFIEAIIIGGIWFVLYLTLLWFNRNNRVECYAPVELSGILCIIPEILMSIILTMPCALWIGFFSFNSIIIFMVLYFRILSIYRKNIITYMNKM